jgi:hypothetical protein
MDDCIDLTGNLFFPECIECGDAAFEKSGGEKYFLFIEQQGRENLHYKIYMLATAPPFYSIFNYETLK